MVWLGELWSTVCHAAVVFQGSFAAQVSFVIPVWLALGSAPLLPGTEPPGLGWCPGRYPHVSAADWNTWEHMEPVRSLLETILFSLQSGVFHLFTHHAQMPPEVRSEVCGPLDRQHSFKNALLLQSVQMQGLIGGLLESQNHLAWEEP